MKIKRYKDFLLETIYSSEFTHEGFDEITFEISPEVFDKFEFGTDDHRKFIDDFVHILELKSAHIILNKDMFSLKGKTKSLIFGKSIDIEIYQKGNFLKLSESEHFDTPKMIFDGIDLEPLIRKRMIETHFLEKNQTIVVINIRRYPMRTIQDFIKLDKDQRENYLKSLKSTDKFNLFESVKSKFDNYTLMEFEDNELDPDMWAKIQAKKLDLIDADVKFLKNFYSIKGKTSNNLKIEIEQYGEYNRCGDPYYDPKMNKPIFKINDIDAYPLLKHILKNKDIDFVNYVMTRLGDFYESDVIKEIYSIFNLPKEERDNYLNSLNIGDKFNLFESVSYDLDQHITNTFLSANADVDEYMEAVTKELNLKSGKVVIHKNHMEIKGTDIYSNKIYMYQKYDHFLSHDNHDPIITFNNIDVVPIVLKDSEKIRINEIDFNLDEIYQYINLSKEERNIALKSLRALKKYNL